MKENPYYPSGRITHCISEAFLNVRKCLNSQDPRISENNSKVCASLSKDNRTKCFHLAREYPSIKIPEACPLDEEACMKKIELALKINQYMKEPVPAKSECDCSVDNEISHNEE